MDLGAQCSQGKKSASSPGMYNLGLPITLSISLLFNLKTHTIHSDGSAVDLELVSISILYSYRDIKLDIILDVRYCNIVISVVFSWFKKAALQ